MVWNIQLIPVHLSWIEESDYLQPVPSTKQEFTHMHTGNTTSDWRPNVVLLNEDTISNKHRAMNLSHAQINLLI